MRVLYFHQHFNTPSGSVGVRSYEFSRHLISKGHQVLMVCGSYKNGHTGLTGSFENGARRGLVDGIDVIEFNLAYSNSNGLLKRAILFLKFAYRSVRVVFSEKYDLVFATSTPLTAGIPGIFARWVKRKPFVFEVRDLWPELPREMGVIKNPVVLTAMSVLEWCSYHSATRCIGLSPGIVKGIQRRGIPFKKISMIPNGCDINLYRQADKTVWRPKAITGSDFLAVFTGAHGVANGLDAIIDAASVLKKKKRMNIKILLIGDGKLKENLVARVEKESLDNVIFHDPVAKEKLIGLMNSADVGLMVLANVPAFYYGTSPNKFFDYLAAGIPILNNYPGWLADLIKENECGLVVKPGDAEDFANALERLADAPDIAKQMGENGLRLAKYQFNRSDLAEEFANVLEKVG
ncbi:MAG: glycosyltransferase family 4 protein [Gammaproteobacteria bacterium]|nr:glycosyltransferase family 4 protein [Gammaproteobacteria bacterium]